MAPRLLSLLTLIESALASQGCASVAKSPSRSVNFHKGLARLALSDGSGAVMLQSFTLADGQICVKAALTWAGSDVVKSESIFPQGENFNWAGAARKIAGVWLNGPARIAAFSDESEEMDAEELSSLIAAG